MKHLEPLVSAVIPAYNYGRFVGDAVDSVLGQTYPAMECIVIDDGSTDDTAVRLRRYGDRIRYFHQNNRGLPAARNAGIRMASGEWIAFLDADDRWHPEKTAIQLRAAASMADLAFLGADGATDSMPDRVPAEPAVTPVGVADLLAGSRFGPSSAMVRLSAFEAVGLFDETLRSAEDRDMWLRLAARFPGARVEAKCFVYRQHAAQMSRNQRVMQESLRRVLTKFFEEHRVRPALRRLGWAHYHLDTALALLGDGDRWSAMSHLVLSLLRHPAPSPGPHSRVKIIASILLGQAGLRWRTRHLDERA